MNPFDDSTNVTHYIKSGNSMFEVRTITKFDMSSEEEEMILEAQEADGWTHQKTVEHRWGNVSQYNLIFFKEVKSRE